MVMMARSCTRWCGWVCRSPCRNCAAAALEFSSRVTASRTTIRAQIDQLAAGGKRVGIWGGTGKAAAFMHQFGVDAARFPLVVDSDAEKAGTYVPGSGQQIVFRDMLKTQAVDVLIIPTQWRAKDIVGEMRRAGIACGQVLIEHDGRLVDYFADAHPYR